MFATLGVEVTLLDKRRDLLDMVDREIVDAFTYQARELGVVTRLGEEVAQLETNGDGQALVVMKSGKQGRLAACHMFGIEARSIAELYPFGIYAIPEIAWVGSHESDLTMQAIPYETGVA